MSKAKRHIHKYHQVQMGYNKVWACARPDCNHYMPQHMSAMVVGKGSICWNCQGDLILDAENMKDDRPECRECRLGKLSELINKVS